MKGRLRECVDINRPFDSGDQLHRKQLRFPSHSDLIGEDYISLSGQNCVREPRVDFPLTD